MEYIQTTPIVDRPMDVWYPEFSTGNEITWQPRDDSLHSWTVDIDGSYWASGAWDFSGSVVVNIDELSYGQHTLDIIIYDVDTNSVADSVNIHVYDDIAPIIAGPANTIAFVDATGQTLTWEISDLHPDTYIVELDGEEYTTGSWTSGEL